MKELAILIERPQGANHSSGKVQGQPNPAIRVIELDNSGVKKKQGHDSIGYSEKQKLVAVAVDVAVAIAVAAAVAIDVFTHHTVGSIYGITVAVGVFAYLLPIEVIYFRVCACH